MTIQMQNIAHTIVTTVYVDGTDTGFIRNTSFQETAPEVKETADVTSLSPERVTNGDS